MPHITVQGVPGKTELNQAGNKTDCYDLAGYLHSFFYLEFDPFTFDAGLLLRGELGREHLGLDSVDSLISIRPFVSSFEASGPSSISPESVGPYSASYSL